MRLDLFGNVPEVADHAISAVGQQDTVQPPLVMFRYSTTIDAALRPVGSDVGLAGFQRVPKDPANLIRVVFFPKDVHDFVEVTADDASGNIAKYGEGSRIDLTNPEVGIDQIDAKRSLIQQRFELFGAMHAALRLPRGDNGPSSGATRRGPAVRAR